MLPAAGAALAILAGESRHLGIVLRNRISVYLGQISYSVYLIHWPLIVFAEYFLFRKLAVAELLAVGVASLIAGDLMYRFIELPFHKGKILSLLPIWGKLSFAPLVALVIIVPATMASINNGWTWRLDKKSSSQVLDAVEFHKTQYGGAGFEVNKVITLGSFGKPEFMIAGDIAKRLNFDYILSYDLSCKISPSCSCFSRERGFDF